MSKSPNKIPVRCIHCGYAWRTASQAYTVSCSKCGLKTPIMSRPDKPIVATPPALKSIRAKLGSRPQDELQDGSTIIGQSLSQATGRVIECESITVPSPTKRHTIFPLRGNLLYKSKGVTNNCELCGLKLKEDKTSVLFDGKTPAHSFCVLDRALQESCGDINAAAHAYDLPWAELVKRAKKLMKAGKLPETTLV